jgi:hypothetical protein
MSKPRLTIRTEMLETKAGPYSDSPRDYSFRVELYSDLGDRLGSLNPERVFWTKNEASRCAAEFEAEWHRSHSLVKALEKVNEFDGTIFIR